MRPWEALCNIVNDGHRGQRLICLGPTRALLVNDVDNLHGVKKRAIIHLAHSTKLFGVAPSHFERRKASQKYAPVLQ
jgi:hypothetical protein